MKTTSHDKNHLLTTATLISDVEVNYTVPRLLLTRGIGDIQCLQVGYASVCKVPNERGKV